MKDPFADLRAREYPGPDARIFLDSASYGLLPLRTIRAVNALVERRNRGDGFDPRDWGRILWRGRQAAADLLGCDVSGIALAPNTSYGVNLAARWVGTLPPGRVVMPDGEFPANVFPWMELERQGFVIDRIPSGAEGRVDEARLLEAAAGPDVRAVAVSAVQFHTGHRVDLEALGDLCSARGIAFAVDGIQALGLDPLDPVTLGIDLLSTGGQKWLCSPWGSGFVYLSERVRRDLRPPLPSWLAFQSTQRMESLLTYDPAFLDDVRRYELHTLGLQDVLGLAESLELLNELGVGRIREYLHGLHEPVLDWIRDTDGAIAVTPEDPEGRAGILAFRVAAGMRELAEAMRAAGLLISVREGAIRLAPHFYTAPTDMERVRDVLDGWSMS
jgi:selenocysteine lyase/cysteine desulfurase